MASLNMLYAFNKMRKADSISLPSINMFDIFSKTSQQQQFNYQQLNNIHHLIINLSFLSFKVMIYTALPNPATDTLSSPFIFCCNNN